MNGRITYFNWTLRPKRRLLYGPIEVVSLIDAVFIVLFFFMLHSAFVLQPGIKVRLPEAPFLDGAPYWSSMIVAITQEDMIFFNDERIPLQGLGDVFSRARHMHPQTPLVVAADSGVSQGRLIEVYTAAFQAGIKEVVMATRSSVQARAVRFGTLKEKSRTRLRSDLDQ